MIQKLLVPEFYKIHDELLINPKSSLIYTIYDEPRIDYGYERDCDIEWCKNHNISANYFNRGGGCIVNSPGNITLFYVQEFDGHTWPIRGMLESLMNWLKDKYKIQKASVSKNDLLIDGYKVASGESRNIRPQYKWQIGGIQISINQSMDIILGACQKKMIKVPAALSDWGINTENIETWIYENFR